MKRKSTLTLLLLVLVVWAGAALAEEFVNIGKFKATYHSGPINLYQGGPMDSVLVIRGKIDMGQTNYYSVLPDSIGGLATDGKTPLADIFYKGDVVPQFKSSEAAGWVIYLYAQTGSNPDLWQKFKAMSNVKMVSNGAILVKLQQNGSETTMPASPGQGTQITKTIGTVQPK